jgi:Domain of unknown function (DUF4345)
MSGGLLRVVLLVVGAVMIALGLNVGLGGIKTLGWQTAGEFVQATDIVAFSNQDNHVRFLGGFWLGCAAFSSRSPPWCLSRGSRG